MNNNIHRLEPTAVPLGAHGTYLNHDLELASAFIGSSKAGVAAQQDYELARSAYDSVAEYVMHATMTRAEHASIAQRMRELAKALQDFERRSVS